MGARLAIATVTVLLAAIATVGATSPVRIAGPTPARFLGLIDGRWHTDFEGPVLGEGSRWIAFRDLGRTRYGILDERTLVRRRVPQGCVPVSVIRAVFLLSCAEFSRLKLFFARSSRVRPVRGSAGEFYGSGTAGFGRHWLFMNHPYRLSPCPPEPASCVRYVAYYLNWRSGRRVVIHDSGPGAHAARDLDDPKLGPDTARLKPSDSYCGFGRAGGWTTRVFGCESPDPPTVSRVRATSRSGRKLMWTIAGGSRPVYLRAYVTATRTRDTVFVAVLHAATTDPHDGSQEPRSYSLFAIPLPPLR